MTNRTLILLLALTVPAISACNKDEEEVPIAPIITYNSISGTDVVQFTNNLQVHIAFEDYQGDIGYQDPDVYSIRVLDARLGDYDWYHIQPMTPNLEELHIKGTYTINLPSLFLLGSGTTESTNFSIQLQDRAGNWSNVVETPVVVIHE